MIDCHSDNLSFGDVYELLLLVHNDNTSKRDVLVLYAYYNMYNHIYYRSIKSSIEFDGVCDMIISLKFYNNLRGLYKSIVSFIMTKKLHERSKYKIKNIYQILEYQKNNNGELPNNTCLTMIKSSVFGIRNPLEYDFSGVHEDDLIELSKIIKKDRLLITKKIVYPTIHVIRSQGETMGYRYPQTGVKSQYIYFQEKSKSQIIVSESKNLSYIENSNNNSVMELSVISKEERKTSSKIYPE